MKRLACVLYLALSFLIASSNLLAQGLPDVPQSLPTERTAEQQHNERIRQKQVAKVYPVTKEPRVLTEGLLAPSWEDRVNHEEFLKQPKTGLIRILPREVYDWQTYHTPVRIDVRGGGAYFSFFHRTHQYGYGSDLELDHNNFTVAFAGADYGMIVSLGDVAIDAIPKDDPRLVFMSGYTPLLNEAEARAEFVRFRNGVTVDGVTFQRTVPMEAGTTYLVRSISFDTSDLLVAFNVVRIDNDGSAILSWKLLKSFPIPELKRTRPTS